MTREEAVRSLVRFDRPIDVLQEVVAGFAFDWDGLPLASLERAHVLEVLTRWRRGDLADEEVEGWANLIEVREDLTLDPADPAVAAAIFDLANPELQGQLREVGFSLIEKLVQ